MTMAKKEKFPQSIIVTLEQAIAPYISRERE
jgi:hypothetical protein